MQYDFRLSGFETGRECSVTAAPSHPAAPEDARAAGIEAKKRLTATRSPSTKRRMRKRFSLEPIYMRVPRLEIVLKSAVF